MIITPEMDCLCPSDSVINQARTRARWAEMERERGV